MQMVDDEHSFVPHHIEESRQKFLADQEKLGYDLAQLLYTLEGKELIQQTFSTVVALLEVRYPLESDEQLKQRIDRILTIGFSYFSFQDFLTYLQITNQLGQTPELLREFGNVEYEDRKAWYQEKYAGTFLKLLHNIWLAQVFEAHQKTGEDLGLLFAARTFHRKAGITDQELLDALYSGWNSGKNIDQAS